MKRAFDLRTNAM